MIFDDVVDRCRIRRRWAIDRRRRSCRGWSQVIKCHSVRRTCHCSGRRCGAKKVLLALSTGDRCTCLPRLSLPVVGVMPSRSVLVHHTCWSTRLKVLGGRLHRCTSLRTMVLHVRVCSIIVACTLQGCKLDDRWWSDVVVDGGARGDTLSWHIDITTASLGIPCPVEAVPSFALPLLPLLPIFYRHQTPRIIDPQLRFFRWDSVFSGHGVWARITSYEW